MVKSSLAASNEENIDKLLLSKLISANDIQVRNILMLSDKRSIVFSRNIAHEISTLVASYAHPQSVYHRKPELLKQLEMLVNFICQSQSDDGTVNAGNIESPPDTAFLIEILCPALTVLRHDQFQETATVIESLSKFVLRAGEGILVGGIHTPNHRWVICSALANIYSLFPDQRYLTRIDEWLAEGVYCDTDGHYPERSAIYSAVENTAFINIARFTGKAYLLNYVRRNLNSYIYYLESNGDIVTNDSRRQDQYLKSARKATILYWQYRFMAIRDRQADFAAVTQFIETLDVFEKDVLNRSLIYFMESDVLKRPLPSPTILPVSFEKMFPASGLLRIKQDKITATFFGGADHPIIIASGRSNSPDFFSYRKGNAVLKYMRLSTSFFNTGYFYSQGLQKQGNKYVLYQKQEAPYYQPLPADLRNKEGDYQLTPSTDNRFWSKMDFDKRPVSNVKTLETTISLTHEKGAIDLEFTVSGTAGVAVTIEMCFETGGLLNGVPSTDMETNFFENESGSYENKGDMIRFGPGNKGHRMLMNLEGERYSTHFGSLKTDGIHVYLTGKTPFKHTLHFS